MREIKKCERKATSCYKTSGDLFKDQNYETYRACIVYLMDDVLMKYIHDMLLKEEFFSNVFKK
jgi:hypothetical protein